jgi:UPF0755 protein
VSHAAPSTQVRPVRRGRRRGPLFAVALLLGLVLVLGLAVVLGVRALGALGEGADDYPGPGSGSVEIAVERGDTASAIGRTLESADVVKSVEAFVAAATDDERSRGIKPGTYTMALQMSADGALARMLDPASRVDSVVTLPEGLRLEAALDLIAENTRLSRGELAAAARDLAGIGVPAWGRKGGTAEGFLFPAQYDVGPTQDATALLSDMVDRFDVAATNVDLVAQARAKNISPYEALIVASLIESEVPPADYAKAARVIYNRLNDGMKLQIDATVNYALDRSTTAVSLADLEVDSPYNTYKYAGLPPTPINSPGEAAMRAALNPADGDWLYWVTVNLETGETKFAETSEGFFELKAELDAYRARTGQ